MAQKHKENDEQLRFLEKMKSVGVDITKYAVAQVCSCIHVVLTPCSSKTLSVSYKFKEEQKMPQSKFVSCQRISVNLLQQLLVEERRNPFSFAHWSNSR